MKAVFIFGVSVICGFEVMRDTPLISKAGKCCEEVAFDQLLFPEVSVEWWITGAWATSRLYHQVSDGPWLGFLPRIRGVYSDTTELLRLRILLRENFLTFYCDFEHILPILKGLGDDY